MTAPDIAYRLACAPVDVLGGTSAQHVALAVACRWAQSDGRFLVRQTAIAAATGLSESSVGRAVKALRVAGVFLPIGVDECRLVVDHLPHADGRSRHTDSRSRQQLPQRLTGGAVPQTAGAVTTRWPDDPGSEPVMTGGAVPQTADAVPQTAGAVTGTKSLNRRTEASVSFPSPLESFEGEGEDARAGEAPAEGLDDFTARELLVIAWLKRNGALMANPATGEDLRREWLQLTTGLGAELVATILAVRSGDFPSDFRKASEAFAVQIDAARRAAAVRAAADLTASTPQPRREDPAESQARAERARAAQLEYEHRKRAAEDERARGPYLEQATALLEIIDRADARRLVIGGPTELGFMGALERVRAGVAAGRVSGLDLAMVRRGWTRVRDYELPAEAPEPTRATGEPVRADQEPATP